MSELITPGEPKTSSAVFSLLSRPGWRPSRASLPPLLQLVLGTLAWRGEPLEAGGALGVFLGDLLEGFFAPEFLQDRQHVGGDHDGLGLQLLGIPQGDEIRAVLLHRNRLHGSQMRLLQMLWKGVVTHASSWRLKRVGSVMNRD